MDGVGRWTALRQTTARWTLSRRTAKRRVANWRTAARRTAARGKCVRKGHTGPPGAQARRGCRRKGRRQGSNGRRSCLSSGSIRSRKWQETWSFNSGSRSDGGGIGTAYWSGRSVVLVASMVNSFPKMSMFTKISQKRPSKCLQISTHRRIFHKISRMFSVLCMDWRINRFCCVSH